MTQLRIARMLTIMLTLAVALPTAAAADHTDGAIYKLVFDAEDMRSAQVEAEVIITEKTLRMAPWGHPHLADGWATFVSNLRITDRSGTPVSFEKAGEGGWGAWNVNAEDGTALKLRYDIEFSHDEYDWNAAGGQDSRPSVTNGSLFLVTKALFIYSPATESAEIEIIAPDHWTISSPWPAIAGSKNRFFVESWISLVNNALVVGDHFQRTISAGDMTIVLALDSHLAQSVDLFVDTFRRQLGAYRKLFGGTPDSIYLVTIRLADEDDGESFENSFNQVILPGRLDKKVIVWANTMGHELFHYWNGNRVLVGKDKSTVEWFGEGFTEYYASLTLFRTGLISQDLWYRKLETYLARHIITTQLWPVETLSLVDAGKEKHKNWLRIYGSGATMALILDIEIRSATGGTRGLDDVMRRLADRFGEPGARFEVGDILSAVNDVSGIDFAEFFDAHITGTDGQLDISATLMKAGIRTEQFSDEFYLSLMTDPSPLQEAIYSGLTTGNNANTPVTN